MKIPPINTIKKSINKINYIPKQSKSTNIKPIKNYAQYLKEYGLK